MFVGCPHHASKLDRRSVPTCPAPFFLLKRVSFGGNGSFARAGGAEASSSCKKDPRFAMSRQHNREKRWEESCKAFDWGACVSPSGSPQTQRSVCAQPMCCRQLRWPL